MASLSVFYAIPLHGTKPEWLEKLKVWREYCRSEPEFIDVPGEHYTLMDPNHVEEFSKILLTEMARQEELAALRLLEEAALDMKACHEEPCRRPSRASLTDANALLSLVAGATRRRSSVTQELVQQVRRRSSATAA